MSGGIILKRSRIGIRGRQKRTNIIIALLFLFILPVMAVIIGSKITEWWVIPTINTDDILKSPEETVSEEEDKAEGGVQEETNGTDNGISEEESGKEAVNLNPISVYMIQVASISDNKNIETLVEELDNYNLPHITYKSDGTYKIYTFASTEREYMEDKIDRVRETYEDAYIAHMHTAQKEIQYLSKENKGTKEVIEDMNLLLELLEQSSDSLYKPDNGEIKLNEYKEVLERHQKLLNQMLGKVKDTDLPKNFANTDDIKKMIEHQEKNIMESLKIIEKGQGSYKLQNYFLDNLFRTLDVIRK